MNDAQMVAMLRHLYAQLVLKSEREVADGLLSPAIRAIEARIKREAQAEPSNAPVLRCDGCK